MRRTWNIKSIDTACAATLQKELNISETLSKILVNRNIKTPQDAQLFLYGKTDDLFDPFLLSDMEKAVSRIKKAVDGKEKIMLYGDYDVDGITSVALLSVIMKSLGADYCTYIPNRIEEGYGLNVDAVKSAKEKNVGIIITVDCGITAFEETQCAKTLGIDLIITDHHEIKDNKIPDAYCVINPHKPDCNYPFKYLAGVGIAYKLAQGLMKKKYYPIEELLDLVAMGTVSDVAPQLSENRILTKKGLDVLNNTKRVGLKSLLAVSGLEKKDIYASHIGYMLGPRINAVGRIGSADVALELLVTDNVLKAGKLAGMLNQENRNRQKIEKDILKEALSMAEREINFNEDRVIVLSNAGWHPGVIGIVASRIQNRYYRPTIMLSVDKKKAKGSGRSINNFDLFKALSASRKHLLNFGGHEQACGLLLETEKIGDFKKELNNYAMKNIKPDDLFPRLNIDMALPFSVLTKEFINELELLKPYGPGNPKPVFLTKSVFAKSNAQFLKRNGVKMLLACDKKICEAISFKKDAIDIPQEGECLDIAYTPGLNNWQGIETIQLDLYDTRINKEAEV